MRECGNCTLCCKLLETHGVPSPRGEYCSYCSVDIGCSIHSIRPDECREYQCMWSQMEEVGIALRPDKLHIIFEKLSDRTIFGLQDPDSELSNRAIGQIQAFNRQGFSVLIMNGNNKTIYRVKEHIKEEIINDFQIHVAKIMEKLRNDGS